MGWTFWSGGLEGDAIYEVTIWAFDTGSGGDRESVWYGNGVLAEEYSFNGSTLPTTDGDYAFSFLAFTDADGKLLISGRRAGDGTAPVVFIDAMQLTLVVPELGTGVLVVAFVAALCCMRRRSGFET